MSVRKITRRNFIRLAGLGMAGGCMAACTPVTSVDSSSLVLTDVSQTPIFVALKPSPSPGNMGTTSTPTLEQIDPTPEPSTTRLPPTAVPSLPRTQASPKSLDVLTEAQKERLAAAALRYTADSEPAAIQVARGLGYLHKDGHPASVCGPLAAAILRDAGLLSRYTDLHEFWLLNPRDGLSILERNFPKEAFTWYQTSQPVSEFDFKTFPLKAGDFLYLYAGDPGSFEHMLIVSRLDEQDRAYAVTNFNTSQGYIIQETLLYDPLEPGKGKLYDWMDRKNSKLGMTGFGGFLLIRFQTPIIDPGPAELDLASAVDAIIEESEGAWRLQIKEINGPVIYARQERHTLHPASVIKVPIAMLFFKSLQEAGVKDYAKELQKGIDGRSYQQLLKAMLVNSEEKATDSLERAILRSRLDELDVMKSWGAGHTYIAIRQSTAYEISLLFEGLFAGRCIDPLPRQIILEYLAAYTPGDDTRLGVLRKHQPQGFPFYNKRGTITDGLLVVADTAIAKLPSLRGDKIYIISAFAYQGQDGTTYSRLETALGKIAEQVWQYNQKK